MKMFPVKVEIETLDDVDEEDGGITFGGRVLVNGRLVHEVVPYAGTMREVVHRELGDLLIETIIKLGGEVWLDGEIQQLRKKT